MASIKTLKFDNNAAEKIKKSKYGSAWPVVYILNNEFEAYIGETINASLRTNQHLANDIRKNLNELHIITGETFNKSSVLDLESFLIKHMAADNKFQLQNGNSGLLNHNYFQKEMYEKKFRGIWNQLKAKGLVNKDLSMIQNSDLFKYSPYKSLTTEQYVIVNDILSVLSDDITKGTQSSFIVEGGAGTGKTLLGIYMIKLLLQAMNDETIFEEDDVEEIVYNVIKIKKQNEQLNIGLVIPMANLRKSLKKCFREIKGLSSKFVLSPNEVAKHNGEFDLLIVDEAHRLRRRVNLTQYKTFDLNNKSFGLGNEGTELDWIIKKSKYQILFYDEKQSIKPTDIRPEKMNEIRLARKTYVYNLKVQQRCILGGNDYVDYITDIFSEFPPVKKINFKKYDFKIFDNINDMVEVIKAKDNEFGLSRNIAGFSWPWLTKNSKRDKLISNTNHANKTFDIEIDGYKYIWNTKPEDWINSSNSVNEIGSIHTTQGFDLNYTGLIIGNDLKYNLDKEQFYVDRSNYYDVKGKYTTTDEELLQYILNIYSTMCVRGMRGTYLYICDEGLKEYLKRYVDTYIN